MKHVHRHMSKDVWILGTFGPEEEDDSVLETLHREERRMGGKWKETYGTVGSLRLMTQRSVDAIVINMVSRPSPSNVDVN